MSMAKTYRLEGFNDLLDVPADRRAACMSDIMYSLALHELAFVDEAKQNPIGSLLWTDDGKHNIDIQDKDGNQVVSLEVTNEGCDEKAIP